MRPHHISATLAALAVPCSVRGRVWNNSLQDQVGLGVDPVTDELHRAVRAATARDEQIIADLFGDGHCKHVYFDVGTNIGVQIRKLYEPELYPNATFLPHFERLFGPPSRRCRVCVIGFEPNRRHARRLDKLQDYLTRVLGVRAHIFRAAVEGMEYRVLQRLIHAQALCVLDAIAVEWHEKLFNHAYLEKAAQSLHLAPQESGVTAVTHLVAQSRKFIEGAVVAAASTSTLDGAASPQPAGDCRLREILEADDETYVLDQPMWPGRRLVGCNTTHRDLRNATEKTRLRSQSDHKLV